jgi:hypothetical protein
MSVFDLAFILAFLASVVLLCAAIVAFLRWRWRRGVTVLRVYGIGLAIYLAIAAGVALLVPQKVLAVGSPWCFDEWCLAVTGVDRQGAGAVDVYRIALRLHRQARRKAQRANGAWNYLIDGNGTRYLPVVDPRDIPLNTLLEPDQSLETSRTFRVPVSVHSLGLITGHGGPYCGPMNLLIIGSAGCLFRKPTMIRIQGHGVGALEHSGPT